MILTTHAVIGAAAASMVPEHPVVAFGVAFASHFIFDAIPHWHYRVRSIQKNKHDRMKNDMIIGKHFVGDVALIGFDALLGAGISLFIFSYLLHLQLALVLIGVVGGILPDPLQFVYWKFRHEPIKSLQRLHMGMHARSDLDDRPILGMGSQIFLMLFFVLLVTLSI